MIVGLICARKDSEGLPGKNLLKLGGRTLLEIALEKAEECPLIGLTILSTDIADRLIPERVKKEVWLSPRPDELCGPRVPKWDVWRDVAERWNEKVTAIVDIDVARPLTTVEDVTGTIEAWKGGGAVPMAAVWKGQARPECDILKQEHQTVTTCFYPYPARQDASDYFGYGGIYVVARDWLAAARGMWPAGYHEIPRAHCFDIDDELDWQIVQDQWRRQNNEMLRGVQVAERAAVNLTREPHGIGTDWASGGCL